MEYLSVAAVATAADVTAVALVRGTTDLPLLLAVATGFAANVVVGLVLQRVVVFRGTRRGVVGASWRYALLVAANVVIGVACVTLVVAWGLPYVAARVGSSVVIVALNYVALRAWVFPGARFTSSSPRPGTR